MIDYKNQEIKKITASQGSITNKAITKKYLVI
jgi:hypothetical protein